MYCVLAPDFINWKQLYFDGEAILAVNYNKNALSIFLK